jgi:hypothetical protein
VTQETFIRYDTRLPLGLNVYAFVNFVGALFLAVGLLAGGRSLARGELALLAVLVLWALLNVGGIFDHRRWAFASELLRLPVTAAVLGFRLVGGSSPVAGRLGLAFAAAFLMSWLLLYRREFDGSPQVFSRVIAPHDCFAQAALIVAEPAGSDPARVGNRAAR